MNGSKPEININDDTEDDTVYAALNSQFRRSLIMTNVVSTPLNEVMEAAFKKVAAGKELKYFWNNKDETVTETRNDLIKTLCCLASKEESDDAIIAGSGEYQVSEYNIPNIAWLDTIVSFSGRIYVTPVQKRRQKWMEQTTRPNNWEDLPGEVLSPNQLKHAYEMPAEYNNAWDSLTEISKDAVDFSELHGAFVPLNAENTEAGVQYLVFDSTKDATYTQALGLVLKVDESFGGKYDAYETSRELIKAMASGTAE